jgi:tryptophan 2,3-dioxygenase
MPPPTYANYLDLEKLLTLQKARSTLAEHDEALLIIRHKYELWFTILAPLINEICSGVPKNVTINRIRESLPLPMKLSRKLPPFSLHRLIVPWQC